MIYTSYFGKAKYIKEKHPSIKMVSIAGKTPDGFDLKYTALAPHIDWWKQWKDEYGEHPNSKASVDFYTANYKLTVLDVLDPHEVKTDLYNLTNSRDIVLLCYETPEKFCHRHLVANWLTNSGIKVKELDYDETSCI